MSPKEKKQLMIAIPILVIALFLLLWQMGVIGGGGGEAPTEPTAGMPQPGAGPGGMPVAPMPGGPGVPPPVGAGPEAAALPGAAGTEGATGQPAAAPAEEGPSLWNARPDPFTPFTRRVVIRPPVPLWPTTGFTSERVAVVPPVLLRKRIIIKPPLITEVTGLRVAGILYNGRAYAIYESGGVAQVVRPGDQVPEGKILAIATNPDRVVLLDIYGERREIKLKAAEAGTYTTPGGFPTPGEPIMPVGPAGPPMPMG